MTKVYLVWKCRSDVITDYFRLSGEAEKNRKHEWNAAKKIQSVWRGHRVRKEYNIKRNAAVEIQRVFKGHFQRKVYNKMKLEKEKKERRQHFAQCAILIQKMWKGFQIRRTIDFHKRKKFLATLQQKGQALKENLQRVQEEEAVRVNEEKLQKVAEEWTTKVGKIHYLISTKANPGVFSSKRDKMATVVVRDKLLEDHIRHQGVSQAKLGTKYFNYKEAHGIEEDSIKLPPITVSRMNTQLLKSQMKKIQGKA